MHEKIYIFLIKNIIFILYFSIFISFSIFLDREQKGKSRSGRRGVSRGNDSSMPEGGSRRGYRSREQQMPQVHGNRKTKNQF